mgnify:FL=1
MDRKEGVKMSIVIKQVTVEFKNHVRAVDQVDLTIPRGIYGLLGETGGEDDTDESADNSAYAKGGRNLVGSHPVRTTAV